MLYRIALCDDSFEQLKILKILIKSIMTKETKEFLIDTFNSSIKFANFMEKNTDAYDIIILDVEMPGLNGINLGKKLRSLNKTVLIVYVTGYNSYVFDAFSVRVFDYIMKPFNHEKFKKTILDMIYKLELEESKEGQKKYLMITYNKILIKIQYSSIIYIEKQKNKVVFECNNKQYEIYESLSSIKDELDESIFVQTHQGYIVNMKKMVSYKKQQLITINGNIIPVSRRHIQDVKSRFFQELRRV